MKEAKVIEIDKNLNIEEGAMSQRMQVASGSCKRQGN